MAKLDKSEKQEDNEISAIQFALDQGIEQEEAKKKVPWYRSYPSAAVRGIATGVKNIGQSMSEPEGLVGENFEELSPVEAYEKYGDIKEQQSEQFEEFKNKILPIGEGLGPRMLERGTTSAIEGAPLALLTGGPSAAIGTGARALAGGGMAEIAKDLGAPGVVQTSLEVGAQGIPNLGKKIPTNTLTAAGRAEGELMEGARRLGMTEEELAMVLKPDNWWDRTLRFFSGKTGRTANRLEQTKDRLGKVYGALEASADATKILSDKDAQSLINSMSTSFSKLPARQREIIQADWDAFIRKPKSANSVIDFWQKIQDPITRGEGKIGILKEPMKEALKKLSPELAQDFELTNKLYGNFSKIREQLRPGLVDSFIKASEAGAAIVAIGTGNVPVMLKVFGPIAGRQLATEMVSNPRLMNMTTRFINSLNRSLPQVSKKIWDQMLVEVGKTNAKAAMQMAGADFEKLLEDMKQEEQKENR